MTISVGERQILGGALDLIADLGGQVVNEKLYGGAGSWTIKSMTTTKPPHRITIVFEADADDEAPDGS